MKAVIHIGLHKTGTTFLQDTAQAQRDRLLAQGICYPEPPQYSGHHQAAWALLAGDASGCAALTAQARDSGAGAMLISSEDLESLIFRPDLARLLIDTLTAGGVTKVEFAIYIRRQDKLFWSHYSELSKHVYVDPVQMFGDVLRLGYLHVEDPRPGEGVSPYWSFCFDHLRHIPAFRAALAGAAEVTVYDFDNRRGEPGAEIFEALGAPGYPWEAPGAQNASLVGKEIGWRYSRRLARHLPEAEGAKRSLLTRTALRRHRLSRRLKERISRILADHYAGDNARLMQGEAGATGKGASR